jgi:hypothetical protein
MKADMVKDVLHKAGVVFFLLWVLSLVSDVLGSYEYKVQFLLIMFVLWAIGSFIDGFREHFAAYKKASTSFRKLGTTFFGIWILLLIFDLFGWLDPWWDPYIIYALALAIISVSIGFSIRAMMTRSGYWQARSTLYGIGIIIVILWGLFKLLGLYTAYQDTILISGIVAFAVGYISGVFTKSQDFDFLEEKIEHITDSMREVTTRRLDVADDVKVLEDGFTIEGRMPVTLEEGTISVDVLDDENVVGTVYFGQGSYDVPLGRQTDSVPFMGYCYCYGTEWPRVVTTQFATSATPSDFERIGLSKEEVRELARILATNKDATAEEIERLRERLQQRGNRISLPFIKVFEGEEGEYVKFGPIEVVDQKGKRSRVRIGSREFVDKEGPDVEMPEGVEISILTTEGTTVISQEDDETKATGPSRDISIDKDAISIKLNDMTYVLSDKKEHLQLHDYEIMTRKEKRALVRTPDFKMTIRGDMVAADQKAKHVHVTNKDQAERLYEMVRAHFPYINKDAMRGSTKSFDHLVDQLSEEFEW